MKQYLLVFDKAEIAGYICYMYVSGNFRLFTNKGAKINLLKMYKM